MDSLKSRVGKLHLKHAAIVAIDGEYYVAIEGSASGQEFSFALTVDMTRMICEEMLSDIKKFTKNRDN